MWVLVIRQERGQHVGPGDPYQRICRPVATLNFFSRLRTPDQENGLWRMAEHLLSHASQKKGVNPTATMRRHGDQTDIFLASMLQDLFCIISIPDMSIHFEPFGFEPLL